MVLHAIMLCLIGIPEYSQTLVSTDTMFLPTVWLVLIHTLSPKDLFIYLFVYSFIC